MVKRIMGLILTGTMIMSLLACGKANTDTLILRRQRRATAIVVSAAVVVRAMRLPLRLQSMLRILKIRHRRYMQ